MAAAARADAELAAGTDRGPLHGIPCAVKDIIAMAEGPTTAQSLILDPAWGAGRDAPVVARLKQAGAVITGKVTTMEFAIGMPDADKPFPLPRNPWDPSTWPGGSSSGSGAGVAAGLFYMALGTDTGGSIRIPAAFCGVSGLMPTFGRVPKTGCVPLGSSLDHIGPLARSAADCAAVLEVIAGHHTSDPDCVDAPFTAESATSDLAGIRVGVAIENQFSDHADPAARPAFDAAVAVLAASGADVREVRLPYWSETATANTVTMAAEALAYHRGDLRTRWTDYFALTRAFVGQGAFVAAADYVQAQRVRRVVQQALGDLFTQVDVVVCPTAQRGGPRYDDMAGWGLPDVAGSMARVNTPYWNCVGNPVLAVSVGFTAAGLPLSMQIAAPPFGEAAALRVGQVYQEHTSWHLREPPAIGEGNFGSANREVATRQQDLLMLATVLEEPRTQARAMLAAAGLAPGTDEAAPMCDSYARFRAAIDATYDVAAARYVDPALRFRATDTGHVDWAP
jgi:aspartyl-tRNA(Asn)/glutamyl-tRNA(Gln) amidotransferase subunit A